MGKQPISGCLTVVARPRLRRLPKIAKEKDGQIRIPSFGRAFSALGVLSWGLTPVS